MNVRPLIEGHFYLCILTIMSDVTVSSAYHQATARVLAHVKQEAYEITAAAQAISQQTKQERETSALTTLREKLFGTRS